MTLKDISQALVQRRKALRLRQEDVSDYVDVSIRTISSIENGEGNFSIETLLKLCDFYGITIDLHVKGESE